MRPFRNRLILKSRTLAIVMVLLVGSVANAQTEVQSKRTSWIEMRLTGCM